MACTKDATANSNKVRTTSGKIFELSSTWNIDNGHLLWPRHGLRLTLTEGLEWHPFYLESSEFWSSDASLRWRMGLELDKYGDGQTVAYLKMECDAPFLVEYEISLPSLYTMEVYSQKKGPIVWKYPLELYRKSSDDKRRNGLKFAAFLEILEDIRKNANGRLTLSCKIKLIKAVNIDSVNTKVQPSAFPVVIDTDLLLEGKYSDVMLAVGQHEIKAHKLMLASQSPVFRAMFDSAMQESSTNRVVITDLDYEVVQEMIHFIYTGESPKLQTMADRLMGAAVKYDLGKLRTICEQTLCAELSVDNAIKLMTIAELYEAEQLKARASLFITNNLDKFVEKSVLEDLKQQYLLKLGIN